MPIELSNATYKAFTDFAAKVSDRTIAAFGDDKNSVKSTNGLDARTIVPSHNWDFIGNVGRRAPKKEANEAVRELFRQSIYDLFGGESMVPESVKTAMKLEDYGKGKPLSARRIRIVKAAIDGVQDMKPIKMDKATAKKLLKQSEAFLGVSLDVYNEANDMATNWLIKFGQGMPAKTARLFSNFIVNSILNFEKDSNISLEDDRIKQVAEEMKTWDEFNFGDKRFEDIGKEFMKRHNNYIQEKLNKPAEFMKSNPDVFKAMELDANRFDWNINGQKFPLGTKKETVIDAFCQAVPNSNARKAISIIFNQTTGSDLSDLIFKTKEKEHGSNVETNLCELPNANNFISYDTQKIVFPISKNIGDTFDLKISEDGNTATVTVTSIMDLCINNSREEYRIGKANIALQSTFDLRNDPPEITNVTFSQNFSPDALNSMPTEK